MCYKNEYQKRAHGEVERIFRELLPEAGLHVREEQIRLCHEMLDALMKNEITLCDAGVGIGKTYAYLTACILMRKYSVLHSGYSGCDRRPVVVSTSSIALQKAIIEEYVPFLSDVLLKADLLQEELKAVVRKGKEHFVCDYRLAQRLEAVRDKNKNQVQMEALKSLRHNFDLDSVHNLSGFDRRLVCVPKFCPRECPGKAGCRYQKYLDTSRKEDIFYRSAITIIFWQMPCTEQMGTGRFWQITGHWSWMRPTSSRKLPVRCMEEALERKMCRKFPIFFPGSIKGAKGNGCRNGLPLFRKRSESIGKMA